MEGVERVLAIERAFILGLGGYSLEIAGASLLTHEKVPVPRFNFVTVHNVGRERQAAFFERVLDHYFQRALRPAFRTRRPVPAHLDAGLRHFGFRRSTNPISLLWAELPRPESLPPQPEVSEVGPEALSRVVRFWAGEREREELARSIDVLLRHPNPGERLTPLVARRGNDDVCTALVYALERAAGVFGVATAPGARGLGAATAMVSYALRHATSPPVEGVAMIADHPRIARRLESLGFRSVGELEEYSLPLGAELALPSPGPPMPPRWRPPRSANP